MSRKNLPVAILWLLLLLGVAGATVYGLQVALDAVSKVIVAVLAGVFGLLAAVLTHALARERERETEWTRLKQQKYSVILSKLAKYVRSNKEDADEFATAVLDAYLIAAQNGGIS